MAGYKSKFINLFFVYLPVFLIFLLMTVVYVSYFFTYIVFLINPSEQPSFYPFSHTTTPQNGKTRGIILISIVSFFFILCIISMLRVIFMNPGYIPSPVELEGQIINRNLQKRQKSHKSFAQSIRKFEDMIKDGPLTNSDNIEVKKCLDDNLASNIDNNNDSSLFVKNENSFKDPFRKYTNIKFNKVILCGSCLRWKVERAHHCRQCGKCVLKMDHHCPWLASCIGFRNYKYFLLIQLHGLIATIIVFFSFIEAIINFNMNDDTDLFLLVGVFFGWACDGGLMAFLLWLFCINWKLMFKGETVIENSDKIRFPSAKMNNIYDLGTYKNFTTVFGNNPLVWFIPAFPNYDGDGISYETNVKDNNQ